jgi:transcriptional regulator with XRE-family HTH domain
MTFAEKLKALRTAAGWTQAEFAEKCGVPLGTIRDYEQGKRDPSLSAVLKLARGLGVSLSAFDMTDAEAPGPAAPKGRASVTKKGKGKGKS